MSNKKPKQEIINELKKKIDSAEKKLQNSSPKDIDKNLTNFIDLKKEYADLING